ncbi:MAG: transporter substrate-binding domain-containing protein [Colwelliaceae bacterium]|nr:transporter substrate-binding domain-containing protein [Colwelliaceae bacterium]
MRLCNIVLLLVCPLLSLITLPVSAQKVLFLTEDLPPLQIENKELPPTGAFVELVNLIIEETNIDAEIVIYPWARSYELALTQPNTFIFSILRGKSREDKFHWVSKLFTLKSYLSTLTSRTDIKIAHISDAKQYSVGSIRDDLAETYMRDKGFQIDKNLYLSSKYPVLWQMLYSGRTDIAFTNNIVWRYEINKTGLDSSQVKLIYEIPDIASDLYLAASLNTDKAIILKVKNSFESIKADGRYDKIMAKWQLDNAKRL